MIAVTAHRMIIFRSLQSTTAITWHSPRRWTQQATVFPSSSSSWLFSRTGNAPHNLPFPLRRIHIVNHDGNYSRIRPFVSSSQFGRNRGRREGQTGRGLLTTTKTTLRGSVIRDCGERLAELRGAVVPALRSKGDFHSTNTCTTLSPFVKIPCDCQSLSPVVTRIRNNSNIWDNRSGTRSSRRQFHSKNSGTHKMKTAFFLRHGPTTIFLLSTTAAFLSSYRPLTVASADYTATAAAQQSITSENGSKVSYEGSSSSCPLYGCPLLPQDVYYNTDAFKHALEQIRSLQRVQILNSTMSLPPSSPSSATNKMIPPPLPRSDDPTDADDHHHQQQQQHRAARAMRQLQAVGTEHAVTLTLIGYKGGPLQEQINQDRSVVVAPYYIHRASSFKTENDNKIINSSTDYHDKEAAFHQKQRILLGVFDGHAPLGEQVSEYARTELPRLLAQKLLQGQQDASVPMSSSTSATTTKTTLDKPLSQVSEQDAEIEWTKQALHDTFVELDANAPAETSGGCTASVVLLQGNKVYFANAGDSQSFLVAYRPSTNQSDIVYITREDKPNLPDERARVEAAGGQVYIPVRGTSRVVYQDARTGAPTGLAMSRSIGDWAAGKMGVIPDPIIDVFDIDTLVATQLHGTEIPDDCVYSVNEKGDVIAVTSKTRNGSSCSNISSKSKGDDDDVYLYAVSATDGMMDFLTPQQIAHVMSDSLFDVTGVHPITAAEHLVFAAANGWQQAKQGRYRDDIAIAVCVLRRPTVSAAVSADSIQDMQNGIIKENSIGNQSQALPQ